jgi:BASS family bile acid:Na+ symporter
MSALETLDSISLNFDSGSLHLLNIAIGFVMFGVALEIKLNSFKDILLAPKPVILGFISQFLLLPAFTFLLILLLKSWLTPTMALGMLLVASCPGGNVSNFISSLARGNIELSVSLTAIATVSAIFLTPLNFAFWGKLAIIFYEHQLMGNFVPPLEIDVYQVFQTIFVILGAPLVVGVFFNSKFPELTKKISPTIKKISIFIFSMIVLLALAKNFDYFLQAIQYIFIIVLLHNALALGLGYSLGSIFRLNTANKKSIAIETGIQNSGLALALIFNPKIFPPDLAMGGMAIIAAWWGIWHIIAGLSIASVWGSDRSFFGLKQIFLKK